MTLTKAPADGLTLESAQGDSLELAFTNVEKASIQLAKAMSALHAAEDRVRKLEGFHQANLHAKGFVVRSSTPGYQTSDEKLEVRQHEELEPVLIAAQRARDRYDLAFAIYQEAARGRDALAANKLAESNARATGMIGWLTAVLAVATIVQAVAAVWKH